MLAKWRKVFEIKKVDKKKVIQELLMTTILHKNVRIIVCLSQRICALLIAAIEGELGGPSGYITLFFVIICYYNLLH